jgi:two-component system chemotaxis response regulator CheY
MSKTCLVVDDSKIVRKVIGRILEPIGFTISEAENGQIALDMLKENTYDLVMLDWNMPVMDGPTCLKGLRESDISPQPKVIFCSTENATSKIMEAIQAGADEYVMKPFDEAIILDKLQQIGVM